MPHEALQAPQADESHMQPWTAWHTSSLGGAELLLQSALTPEEQPTARTRRPTPHWLSQPPQAPANQVQPSLA
jgi:hypothetical protein